MGAETHTIPYGGVVKEWMVLGMLVVAITIVSMLLVNWAWRYGNWWWSDLVERKAADAVASAQPSQAAAVVSAVSPAQLSSISRGGGGGGHYRK